MWPRKCRYVVGFERNVGQRLCGKRTWFLAFDSWLPWSRTPICFEHMKYSTRSPKEWVED